MSVTYACIAKMKYMQTVNMKYIIKDWAGNILHFNGRFERPEFAAPMEFETEDDANEYLTELFDTFGAPSELEQEFLDEYVVCEVTND